MYMLQKFSFDEGLSNAQRRITYVRVVGSTADNRFVFHGVWMITGLYQQSDAVVQVDMMSMPDLL